MRLLLAGALSGALAAVTGCTGDTSGSVSPRPRANQLPALIASAPVAPSAVGHVVGQGAPPTDGVVYVSLPPGSVPAGFSATIRDVESGHAVTAAVLDGGFDPVAITATIGDTLLVSIQSVRSASAMVGYLTVSEPRPPVVVRTNPPPKKVDVPLNAFMVAVFSTPLDAATVNASTVTLWRGSTPVPGTVRFADAPQLRVEFHPDTLLAGDTDYQLILGKGLHDVNGVAFDSVVTVPFTTASTLPAPVSNLVFASVSVGYDYACGVTTAGAAYCWGDNYTGKLGDSSASVSSLTPVAVAGGLTFATVSAGAGGTCGVTTSGAAYCWGSGENASSTPVPVGGGLTFASVSTGFVHSCGVTTTGAAYCWGEGYYGELGVGSPLPSAVTPVAVLGGLTFTSVSAGYDQTCGVTTTGSAYCWGMNTLGELGIGTLTGPEECTNGGSYACSTIPVPVAGGLTFATVSAGGTHSCGMTTSGAPYCWGNDVHDILGSGTNLNGTSPFAGPEQCADIAGLGQDWYPDTLPCSRVPRIVGGGLVLASLSTRGDWFGCGLTPTGVASCWGGDRGIGDLSTTAPVAVAGGLTFRMLSAGLNSTCGVTTGGVVYCWGANERGQLGDGTTTPSDVPVKVAGQP